MVWEQCKFRGYWNNPFCVRDENEFESSVNSEGIETGSSSSTSFTAFESSVNSEGIETRAYSKAKKYCLRAV